jgi:hypothetical protein
MTSAIVASAAATGSQIASPQTGQRLFARRRGSLAVNATMVVSFHHRP